ncbi:hypothetical protein BDV96DRAFT_217347 [Lophiotrema nucula]|uniref:Uncharacterized protein n=1 Tax=Lophiotrema nucula TaxID=690887 RepID=A0A6A5ZPI2_9PLEO|nr:hypothetical protein BDV96DRAFT_217347 [Lophiotrema nucula]
MRIILNAELTSSSCLYNKTTDEEYNTVRVFPDTRSDVCALRRDDKEQFAKLQTRLLYNTNRMQVCQPAFPRATSRRTHSPATLSKSYNIYRSLSRCLVHSTCIEKTPVVHFTKLQTRLLYNTKRMQVDTPAFPRSTSRRVQLSTAQSQSYNICGTLSRCLVHSICIEKTLFVHCMELHTRLLHNTRMSAGRCTCSLSTYFEKTPFIRCAKLVKQLWDNAGILSIIRRTSRRLQLSTAWSCVTVVVQYEYIRRNALLRDT